MINLVENSSGNPLWFKADTEYIEIEVFEKVNSLLNKKFDYKKDGHTKKKKEMIHYVGYND